MKKQAFKNLKLNQILIFFQHCSIFMSLTITHSHFFMFTGHGIQKNCLNYRYHVLNSYFISPATVNVSLNKNETFKNNSTIFFNSCQDQKKTLTVSCYFSPLTSLKPISGASNRFRGTVIVRNAIFINRSLICILVAGDDIARTRSPVASLIEDSKERRRRRA